MSHKARKRFGQHFLTDISVLNRITSAIHVKNDASVIEIGPGQGALTEYLLSRFDKLTVIELDRDLVSLLQKRYNDKLNIVSADILTIDFCDVIKQFDLPSRLTIVGNLPYNISTPLVFHLLNQVDIIDDMVFMVQKEVAERICATPGTKQYGRLSVMASTFLNCEMLFDVPPSSFNPPPKVDSSVMRLTPKVKTPEIQNPQQFEKIVKQAFSQRRKTINNALKGLIDTEQLQQCDIDPKARAENLSPTDFIRLSEWLPTT